MTTKKIKGQFAQGDVLLERIADMDPKGLGKPVATKRITLALGEVTGHSHVIEGTAVAEFVDPKTGHRIFWIESPAVVTHQEHGTISLAPGWYEYRQPQAEYAPEDIRAVMD